MTLSSCYWLARSDDLSSGYGGAGVDAGQSGPFCPPDAGALAYCMAFDGVDAGALGLAVIGANVTIANGTYVSAPSSLFVALQGAASFGRYAVSFPVQPTTTRLEFQMHAVDLNEGVTTLAVSLTEAATQIDRTLNVVVTPNGGFQVQEYFAFADGGGEVSAHDQVYIDAGEPSAWHHVVLTLTVDDADKHYLSGMTVDDQVLEDGRPLALPWVGGTVALHIGVTFAAAGGPQFFFDNVRADFTP
jgi:hypothetical protein